MPLEKFPKVTRDDVNKAERDRLNTFALAVGGVAGLTAVNWRLNAPGGPILQKPLQMALTGVKAIPTATGRAALSIPKASLPGFLAPAPIGFVPGEFLGLHPDVVFRTLGIHAGKKPIVFAATEQRKTVFEATIEAERIAARALKTEVLFGRASGHPFRDIPPGRIDVTEEELEFLESLPPGLTPAQRLIPQLQARRAELTPSGLFAGRLFAVIGPAVPPAAPPGERILLPWSGTRVPSASIQPEHIQPVNSAALANAEAAEGIRAALVSERADP